MGSVHRLGSAPGGRPLGASVEDFLSELTNPNTARAYAIVLRALSVELGSETSVATLDEEVTLTQIDIWFARRWGSASAATVNARLDALRSAALWWRDQGWIRGDPMRRIRRRSRTPDRTLWRLLYETAARAGEVLSLDVDDLDLRNRRAKVRRKGGAADIIVWRTKTARLLPRLLDGRRAGPVFLTDRRARVELAPVDVEPVSGRARLSYRRAAELFEQATESCPQGPWTLHQLRHSALTHAAEDGANTSTLLAFSGHTSVVSLSRYARVSPDGLARWQQQRDPATRRA